MTKPETFRKLPASVWRASSRGQFVKAAWLQSRHEARHSARWLAELIAHRGFGFGNLACQ